MGIKKILRRNTFALSMIAKANNYLYNFSNEKEIIRRSRLPFFNYRALAEDTRASFYDIYPENNLYGMSRMLRTYAGGSRFFSPSHCFIEHGLFFGNYVAIYSYLYSDIKRIITFGDYREKVLLNSNLIKEETEIVKIGPYIQYAKSLLSSEERTLLKNELGKTLLVFPSHSIPKGDVVFDDNVLYSKIDEVKKELGFDTVLVCLYWKDIQNNTMIESCLSKGYRIVTAGHRNDPLFLNRLKAIIELSDYTMSNDVGTNLGYCICLGKPHFAFHQNIDYKEGLEAFIKSDEGKKEVFNTDIEIKNELAYLFSEIEPCITKKQKEAYDYYWGGNYSLTPQEVNQIYV